MRSVQRDQCCLCGKTKEQVRKLIVGLHGAVCSDCIDLCNDILHDKRESLPERPVEWDGTIVVAAEDRDVFANPIEARRALSALADLVRGYAASSADGEPGEGTNLAP